MLRTSLFAPLAGAFLVASPAVGQVDNRPGAYQPYAEDEQDAQQRDRYAYPRGDYRDDYRDAVRDQDEASDSYTVEPDRTESPVARDYYQRERPVARRRFDDRSDMDREQDTKYAYPPTTSRWDDRDQGADAPATNRSEPFRSDREEALPQDEVMPPAGTDEAGTPLTPARAMSSNFSSAEAIWHVRGALNVAALGCRDAKDARTVSAYNGMLSARRATLAAADAQTKALYRIRFGGRWQNMHDTAMTKLYNFFAQPPAHDDFCRVARQVLYEEQWVPDAIFATFANDALARLEAPFYSRRLTVG